MKKEIIKASRNVNGKKELVGEREEMIPETVKDITDNWDEVDILSCFTYGWRVKVQSELRSETDPKAPSTIFKKLPKTEQEKILKEYGLLG